MKTILAWYKYVAVVAINVDNYLTQPAIVYGFNSHVEYCLLSLPNFTCTESVMKLFMDVIKCYCQGKSLSGNKYPIALS